LTLSSFCANAADDQVKAMAVIAKMTVRVSQRGSRRAADRTFKLDNIPASYFRLHHFGPLVDFGPFDLLV
jgi:hypothetical protein